MTVLLAPCCCTGSDPCDTDWNFWDCCSGRRMFDDPLSPFPPALHPSLGVAVNWGPPSGSGSILKRESDLRAFGSQFPNSFQSLGFTVYPAAGASKTGILNGEVQPIASGQYDRLEFVMRGPTFCGVQGCSKIADGFIALSSSDFDIPPFRIGFEFNRGTTRDGGLLSDCSPAPGVHPDFCPQCPQDLDPTTKLSDYRRPNPYVKGNACGIPADIQAIIEASDPGSISDSWYPRANRCSGGTGYFGGCTEGWYADSCEDETTTEYGTIFAGYGECSCCAEDWDDQQISLQVIT